MEHNHLSCMDFLSLLVGRAHFQLGMLDDCFSLVLFGLFFNYKKTYFGQTVQILIRRHNVRRLIWDCTVCLCLVKRTECLYK